MAVTAKFDYEITATIIQDVIDLMRKRRIYTREVHIFACVLAGILKLESEAVSVEYWIVGEPERLNEGQHVAQRI